MVIETKSFGQLGEGLKATLYTLTNKNNVSFSVTNYGGIITEIYVPDKQGKISDIVLGYDNVEDYVNESPYFGAIVGRYGNRIANGKFTLNDNEYNLASNDGSNHLHGGIKGFDKVLWEVEEFNNKNKCGLILKYLSKDGEEGFPGNLNAEVKYTLTNDNELKIDYKAKTDKPTICNLTNHSYFNLKDGGKTNILDHEVEIFADQYIPIDSTFIPLGKLELVTGTPFDFSKSTKIGQRINENHIQLKNGIGYDHNFVLNGSSGIMKLSARVFEETSGRILELYTEEPGVQFYCGNFLNGALIGKDEVIYNHRNGFCLETQHFPDSPNRPEWPTTMLNPGEIYETSTIYKFSIRK